MLQQLQKEDEMRQWLKFFLVAILSIGMVGCVTQVPLDAKVGIEHNGKHVTVNQGQQVVVELKRAPDSAYVWTLVNKGEKVLSAQPKQASRPQEGKLLTERFVFVAMRKGIDTIRIERLKVGDSEPQQVFEMNVTVN